MLLTMNICNFWSIKSHLLKNENSHEYLIMGKIYLVIHVDGNSKFSDNILVHMLHMTIFQFDRSTAHSLNSQAQMCLTLNLRGWSFNTIHMPHNAENCCKE